MASELLDVKTSDPPAAGLHCLANGDDQWPSTEDKDVDMKASLPSVEKETPCVGKFVIKRTSKVNGEDKFTFRRKRRSRKSTAAGNNKKAPAAKRKTMGSVQKCARRKKVKIVATGTPTAMSSSTACEDESCNECSEVPWGTSIPFGVLLIVFKKVVRSEGVLPFLKRASKVCKLWKSVADHPSLWTHIDVSKPKVSLTASQLVTLSRLRFANARELNLSAWGVNLKLPAIQTIIEACPKLTSLNLSGCKKITGSLLKVIIDKCPKLTGLDISHVQNNTAADNAVSHNSMSYLVSKLGSKFQCLNIGGNVVRGLRAVITVIAEGLPELRELDMSGVESTCDSTIQLEKLQQGCTKLRVFRLANIANLRLASIPLTEQASSPGFPDLEELSIGKIYETYDPGLNEPSLERILKSSRKLKLLDLRGCSRISSSSLVRTLAWDLEHLFLSGCMGTMTPGLELVMQKWAHSLVQVDLSWNNQSGESIDLAVKALTELTTSESPLRMLNLCGSSVSIDSVKSVLSNCPKLEVLNLTSCRCLPRGIKRIYNVDEIVKLKTDVEALIV